MFISKNILRVLFFLVISLCSGCSAPRLLDRYQLPPDETLLLFKSSVDLRSAYYAEKIGGYGMFQINSVQAHDEQVIFENNDSQYKLIRVSTAKLLYVRSSTHIVKLEQLTFDWSDMNLIFSLKPGTINYLGEFEVFFARGEGGLLKNHRDERSAINFLKEKYPDTFEKYGLTHVKFQTEI